MAASSVSTGVVNAQGQHAFDGEIATVLGAQEHPNITFVSRAIELTGPDTGLITGDLSLNGVTLPVVLDARFTGGRSFPEWGFRALAFSARTTIRRSDFGVSQWTQFAGDDVEILIETEFDQDLAPDH